MDFHFEGIEELERDFRRIEVMLSDAARHAVETGAREGVAEAKTNHRYKDRTGRLTGTATSRLETSAPGGATALMVWPMRYASYVENGTAPHIIVGNPFLSFVWHGVRMNLRFVHHPGTRPYGFAGAAYQKAERVIYRELDLGVMRSQRILDEAA